MAAGISTTWYTWLEQGRPLGVSTHTLHAIARALQLEAAEFAHLSALADAAAGDRSIETRRTMRPSPALHLLLDALHPNAAFAINALWDVLAANHAAVALLGDFAEHPGTTDNVLRRLFLDTEWRERLVGWPSLADWAVAHFRAATARYVGHPDWEGFVERLAAESPDFAERWARYEIRGVASAIVEVRGADGASARYHAEALAVDAAAGDVRVALYIPLGEAPPNAERR